MYNHFSVSGWATVYIALETAAFTLAKSLTDETVNVVNFKYVETGIILADSHDSLHFSALLLGMVERQESSQRTHFILWGTSEWRTTM